MTILDKMLERVGKTRLDVNKNSTLGKLFKQQGVQRTPELNRIAEIPRRIWEEEEDLSDLLTDVLRLPGGTMRLRPVQAASLRDLHDFGGLVNPVRVGGGKTLISFLAPTVVEAQRPLLVVPGGLKEKTVRDFIKLSQEWQSHHNYRIESYERISRVNGNELLQEIAPDLIILDEAHRAKNPKAAVTKRLRRWIENNPETKLAALSGTLISRSILDFAHLLDWALPPELRPIPRSYTERGSWALAIDERLPPNAQRLAPGALEVLYNDEEKSIVSPEVAVRRAFRRRLAETPGVVATEEGFLGASLRVEALEFKPNQDVAQALRSLFDGWQRPDGVDLTSPMEVWRCARELALGFFYIWDPPGPEDWMQARRKWSAAVRHILGHNQRQLDSELPVKMACRRGEYDRDFVSQNGVRLFDEPIGDIYRAWEKIQPTFEPNTVPVWIDDSALEVCKKWMEKNKGIVWVDHVAFGKKLSEFTGRPYFAQKGLDTSGKFIDDFEPEDGSIIASISANSAGRNLQHWSKALVASAPPGGVVWEQMLGRIHRDGQEAEEVSYEVLIGSYEQWSSFEQAVENAFFLQDTSGQAQKLCYADKVFPTTEEIATRRGGLWER